jgi:Kef-type K+ transport system membrane component KefB
VAAAFRLETAALLTHPAPIVHPALPMRRVPAIRCGARTLRRTVVAASRSTVHLRNVPVVLWLLQIAVILAACRLLRGILGRIGQPPVVGEIIAGLLLGPSFLGWLAPVWYANLFPAASLPALNELSQIGLVLFMFLVGLHLDLAEVYALRRVAGLAGLLSIAVPFASGLALARPLHVFAPSSPMLPFSLFIAISMSITAFPVLARILDDWNLTKTELGHIAIACAALNDVLAWSLLAWVVTLAQSGGSASVTGQIVTVAIYILAMFAAVRPTLAWLTRRFQITSELTSLLIFVFLSSWVSGIIGIHALFGAFLAGVVWPRSDANLQTVAGKIEPITMAILIPLFFSYTGLRTNIGALGGHLWLTVLAITAVATVGKAGGTFAGAKIMGFDTRSSLSLGWLLNTRGLVELVVLNVGLDLGILSPTLFSMMVAMAVATTMMTTPALKLALPAKYLSTSGYEHGETALAHRPD